MDTKTTLLMIGMSSCTYQVGKVVIKVPRIDEETEITHENAKAMTVEANAYKILGGHSRIANCLYISPTKDLIILDFYVNGNLKDYVTKHGPVQLHKWGRQMIEGVVLVHEKGIRHSDIRLDQWLLDSGMNARLSDFNASGYDEHPDLGIQSARALGHESPSHFMPRNICEDNTIQSDLFALGSALYELEMGSAPFAELSEESITERFAKGDYPPVSSLVLGSIVTGCWKSKYNSATEILLQGEKLCEL